MLYCTSKVKLVPVVFYIYDSVKNPYCLLSLGRCQIKVYCVYVADPIQVCLQLRPPRLHGRISQALARVQCSVMLYRAFELLFNSFLESDQYRLECLYHDPRELIYRFYFWIVNVKLSKEVHHLLLTTVI